MEKLPPIIEPTPIEFSFAAPGWMYLGMTAIIILLLVILIKAIRYYKNKYRRDAISQVILANDLRSINVILKSLALKSFGRENVAPLYGKEWSCFLLSKLKTSEMEAENLTQILDLALTPGSMNHEVLTEFKHFSTHWIKYYHV